MNKKFLSFVLSGLFLLPIGINSKAYTDEDYRIVRRILQEEAVEDEMTLSEEIDQEIAILNTIINEIEEADEEGLAEEDFQFDADWYRDLGFDFYREDRDTQLAIAEDFLELLNDMRRAETEDNDYLDGINSDDDDSGMNIDC